MARRPNLSAVDLSDTSKPAPTEHAKGRKAQTLRLPPQYWRKLRIAAAVMETSQVAIAQQALNEWFARHPLPTDLGL